MGRTRRTTATLESFAQYCGLIVLGQIEPETEQQYTLTYKGFQVYEKDDASKMGKKSKKSKESSYGRVSKAEASVRVRSVKFKVEKVIQGEIEGDGDMIEVFMNHKIRRELKRKWNPRCDFLIHKYPRGELERVNMQEKVVLYLAKDPIVNGEGADQVVINKNGFRLYCEHAFDSPKHLEEIEEKLKEWKEKQK